MINNNQLANTGLTLIRSQIKRLSLLQSHYSHFSHLFSLSSIPPSNPSLKIPISPFSHSPSLCRNPIEDDTIRGPDGPPKLLVVQPRVRPNTHLQTKLNEALNLANSLEEQSDGCFSTDLNLKKSPPHVVVQNPLTNSCKGRSDTYFGPGTVENIKCHIHAIESENGELDAVYVNAMLSAIQKRNLERAWDKPVLDRVGLIIEIFNAHAYTKEAKLQAELAATMYKKSRLVQVRATDGHYAFGTKGKAEVVSARGKCFKTLAREASRPSGLGGRSGTQCASPMGRNRGSLGVRISLRGEISNSKDQSLQRFNLANDKENS